MNKSLSKAETLEYLRERLAHSIIDDLVVFRVTEWKSERKNVLDKIFSHFPFGQSLIIRSSVAGEDSPSKSAAGHYHSEPDVILDNCDRLINSIDKVIGSYSKDDRLCDREDQFIVQSHLQRALCSGVVLTRDPVVDSPYYVINYDDRTGRTDTVTGGLVNKILRIFRRQDFTRLMPPWDKLLLSVYEIEHILQQDTLDIEFGLDSNGDVHIFQVRMLNSQEQQIPMSIRDVESAIRQIQSELPRLIQNSQHLAGSRIILADMSDWNPAEILGSRPNFLDNSLYRFLVTQSAWNEARVSLGYTNVAPAELMITIADKPYIDTRTSFNSLTPAGLPLSLVRKLLDYYLDKLARQPELQDKVEFEIVLTCFDFSFADRAVELRWHGFSEAELDQIRKHLLAFTNGLLNKASDIFRADLESVRRLIRVKNPYSVPGDVSYLLDEAYQSLTACRQLGVLPFARLARLAFIGLTLLKSLVKIDVIEDLLYDEFLDSIETVAKQMSRDSHQLALGTIDMHMFMQKYGHLRPGTYNITSRRYDAMPDLFNTSLPVHTLPEPYKFSIDGSSAERIDQALAQHGIQCQTQELFDFIRHAIEYRELAKFEFTKILSDDIELIALAGERLGFSREELAFIDLNTLMRAQSTTNTTSHIKEIWQRTIDQNRELKAQFSRVALPPVLQSEQDLMVVPHYESSPNFVTRKRVEGAICLLKPTLQDFFPDVTDRIVFIESADPGHDWIFTKQPRGLVTKYGGVASHMAIRCAEMGLAAAIGCGELLFDRLAMSSGVVLDCATELIVPL